MTERETRTLNGVVYEKCMKPSGLIAWDGGARGGVIDQYPSGMFFAREIGWVIGFADAAQLMQQHQLKRYQDACDFIRNWKAKT